MLAELLLAHIQKSEHKETQAVGAFRAVSEAAVASRHHSLRVAVTETCERTRFSQFCCRVLQEVEKTAMRSIT